MNYVLTSRHWVQFLSLVVVASSLRADTAGPLLDAGSNLMLRSSDVQFAMRLSQSATGTAAVCKSVSSRSKNPEVQSLARAIADSSLKLRGSLVSIAGPMRITLPEEVPATELSTFTKLQYLPANRIDHIYLGAQLKQLRKNIQAVKTEIKKGKIRDIQNFAIDVLPVLEAHLEQVGALYRAVPKK